MSKFPKDVFQGIFIVWKAKNRLISMYEEYYLGENEYRMIIMLVCWMMVLYLTCQVSKISCLLCLSYLRARPARIHSSQFVCMLAVPLASSRRIDMFLSLWGSNLVFPWGISDCRKLKSWRRDFVMTSELHSHSWALALWCDYATGDNRRSHIYFLLINHSMTLMLIVCF